MEEGGLGEEIEVLEAIYVEELNIKQDDSGVTQILLQLHPATGDDLDQRFVCMTLILNLSSKYPLELPDIIIRNPRGIAEEEIASLREDMHTLCEERRGVPMLYELIELAKDSLTAGNIPHCPCMICLEHFHEGEKFTKTECYHYFHESCLSCYVNHFHTQTPEILPSHAMPSEPKSQLVCPVCREQIHVDMDDLCTVTEKDAFIFIPNDEIRQLQREMSAVLERQKACGGIIDIEAEKNKYLVTNQDIVVLQLPQSKQETKVHKSRQDSRNKTSQKGDRSPRGNSAIDDRNVSLRDSDKDLDRRNNQSDKRQRSGYDKDRDRIRKGSGMGNRHFDNKPVQYKSRGDKKCVQRSNGKEFKDMDKIPQKIMFTKNEEDKDTDNVVNKSSESDKIDNVSKDLESKLNFSDAKDNKKSSAEKNNMNSDAPKTEEVEEGNQHKLDDKNVNTKPNSPRREGFERARENQSRDCKYEDKYGARNRWGFGRPKENQSRDCKYEDKYDPRNRGGFGRHKENQSRDEKFDDKSGARNRGGFGRPKENQSRDGKLIDKSNARNRDGFGSARENQARDGKLEDKSDARSRGGFGRSGENQAKDGTLDDKSDARNKGGFGRPRENPSRDGTYDDRNYAKGDVRKSGGFGRPRETHSRPGKYDNTNDARNRGGFHREDQTRDEKYNDERGSRNKGGFGRPRENQARDGKYDDERGSRNKGGFGRLNSSGRYVNRQDNYDRETVQEDKMEDARRGGFGTPKKDDLHIDDHRIKSEAGDELNADNDKEIERGQTDSRKINSARGSKHFHASDRKYVPRNDRTYGPRKYGRNDNFKATNKNDIKEHFDDSKDDNSETTIGVGNLNKPEMSNLSGNNENKQPVKNHNIRSNEGKEAKQHIDIAKSGAPPGFKVAPPPGFGRVLDESTS